MSSDLLQALKPGVEIDGYRIEKVIGAGGFGVTYLGRDKALDKNVAIKEYLPRDLAVRVDELSIRAASSADNDDFNWGLERFLHEARILARFDHANIVSVLRFFEAHGTAYIVMEHIEGETLSALLKREKTLPYERLKAIMDPVISGLELVHQADFLHRDIKPENIIIRGDGTPVLIDFGSARQAIGVKSRSITAIVSAGYAPIEQYDTSGNQGPWTDIYALGAVAYCAITGKRPGDATGRIKRDPHVALMEAGLSETLGYPEPFLKAIDNALAVDEEDRPQSIEAFRALSASTPDALSNAAISNPTPIDDMAATHVLPKDSSPVQQSKAPANDGTASSAPSRSRSPMKAILASAAVLAAIGLGSVYMMMDDEPGTLAEQRIATLPAEVDLSVDKAAKAQKDAEDRLATIRAETQLEEEKAQAQQEEIASLAAAAAQAQREADARLAAIKAEAQREEDARLAAAAAQAIIPDGSDRDAQPILRVPPMFPPRFLQQSNHSGYCEVQYDVNAAGNTFNVVTTLCSDELLAPATIVAVQKWKYNPKIVDGHPDISTRFKATVKFVLADERGRMLPMPPGL